MLNIFQVCFKSFWYSILFQKRLYFKKLQFLWNAWWRKSITKSKYRTKTPKHPLTRVNKAILDKCDPKRTHKCILIVAYELSAVLHKIRQMSDIIFAWQNFAWQILRKPSLKLHVQISNRNTSNVTDVVLVSLLLTFNIFHTLF